jgi:MYXO-CTERM domain-containing protein
MSACVTRNILRSPSVNLALVVSLGILGCGEAKQASTEVEPAPNGIVGTVHALIANYGDHSETYYRLKKDDGTDVALDFGALSTKVHTGERIAVRGVEEGKSLKVSAFDVVQTRIGDTRQQLLTGAPTQRNFKVAAISLDTNLSKATFAKRVFDDADSPTSFYRDNSYGDWVFTGDAYGPYTIALKTCGIDDLYPIADQAAAAAKGDGFDPANYDNVMYYMPSSQGCSWGGIAEVGINEVRGFWNAKHSWYRGTGCVVLAQELGHNYGLLHSHNCTGGPYGNGASYGGSSCPGYSEYGDPNTPMGGGCGHFNSPEMGAMRFISGCNTIEVTSSGIFEIGPLEKKCAGPQVIRVPTNTMANRGPQYIYIEFRLGGAGGSKTVPSDNKSPRGIYFFASAEYGGAPTGIVADMHDLDYAVDPFRIRGELATVGTSWTEPVSGATFKLNAIGDTATVEVTITGGSGGAPQCLGGGTPPTSPSCGAVTDAGVPDSGTGGAGGTGPVDAGPDTGTGGAGGATGGTAGKAGASGSAGAGGATGGAAGTGGATGGTAGKGGAGGATGGAAGTGGTTGGAAGSGGTAGGAAGSGTGGTAGAAAGAGGGKGGTGGTGGSTTGGTPPPSDDGCSCSVPGGSGSPRTPALLLGLAALIPALRRRRRAS